MSELRERIARVLLEFPLNGCHCPAANPCGWCKTASDEMADAVIAALGLESEYQFRIIDDYQLLTECRYITPWERIEDDA